MRWGFSTPTFRSCATIRASRCGHRCGGPAYEVHYSLLRLLVSESFDVMLSAGTIAARARLSELGRNSHDPGLRGSRDRHSLRSSVGSAPGARSAASGVEAGARQSPQGLALFRDAREEHPARLRLRLLRD